MNQTIKTAAVAFALAATTASALAIPTVVSYDEIQTQNVVLKDTQTVFSTSVDSASDYGYGIFIYASKGVTVTPPAIILLDSVMIDTGVWYGILVPSVDSAKLDFAVVGTQADTVHFDIGLISPKASTVYGEFSVPAMLTFGIPEFTSKPSVFGLYTPAGKTKAKKVSFPVITKISKNAPAAMPVAQLKSKIKLYSPKTISQSYKNGDSLADSVGVIKTGINTNIVLNLVAKLKKAEEELGLFEVVPPTVDTIISTDTVMINSVTHRLATDADTTVVEANAMDGETVVMISIKNQGVKVVKADKFSTSLKGWIEAPEVDENDFVVEGKIKKFPVKFDLKDARYNEDTDTYTVSFTSTKLKKSKVNLYTTVVIDNGVGIATFPIFVKKAAE